MAKFCGNCGKQLEDDAKICGYCGNYEEEQHVKKKIISSHTVKIIKRICILCIIFGVIIAAGTISLKTFWYMTGCEKPLNEFVSYMNDYDIDKLISVSSEIGMKNDSIYNYEDQISSDISSRLDGYEESVGHDLKISCRITDTYYLAERKLQEFRKSVNNKYDYDTDGITDVAVVDITIVAKGSEGESETNSGKAYVIKEDGAWKIYLGYVDDSFESNAFSILY